MKIWMILQLLVSTRQCHSSYSMNHGRFITSFVPQTPNIEKWWFWLASAITRLNEFRLLSVGLFGVQNLCQQAMDPRSVEIKYTIRNGRYSARNTLKSCEKCRKTCTLHHSLWWWLFTLPLGFWKIYNKFLEFEVLRIDLEKDESQGRGLN